MDRALARPGVVSATARWGRACRRRRGTTTRIGEQRQGQASGQPPRCGTRPRRRTPAGPRRHPSARSGGTSGTPARPPPPRPRLAAPRRADMIEQRAKQGIGTGRQRRMGVIAASLRIERPADHRKQGAGFPAHRGGGPAFPERDAVTPTASLRLRPGMSPKLGRRPAICWAHWQGVAVGLLADRTTPHCIYCPGAFGSRR